MAMAAEGAVVALTVVFQAVQTIAEMTKDFEDAKEEVQELRRSINQLLALHTDLHNQFSSSASLPPAIQVAVDNLIQSLRYVEKWLKKNRKNLIKGLNPIKNWLMSAYQLQDIARMARILNTRLQETKSTLQIKNITSEFNASTVLGESPLAVSFWQRSFGGSQNQAPVVSMISALDDKGSYPINTNPHLRSLFLELMDPTKSNIVTIGAFKKLMQWFYDVGIVGKNLQNLFEMGCMHAHFTAKEAEVHLRGKKLGTFCIRLSQSTPDDFVISWVGRSTTNEITVFHTLIKQAPKIEGVANSFCSWSVFEEHPNSKNLQNSTRTNIASLLRALVGLKIYITGSCCKEQIHLQMAGSRATMYNAIPDAIAQQLDSLEVYMPESNSWGNKKVESVSQDDARRTILSSAGKCITLWVENGEGVYEKLEWIAANNDIVGVKAVPSVDRAKKWLMRHEDDLPAFIEHHLFRIVIPFEEGILFASEMQESNIWQGVPVMLILPPEMAHHQLKGLPTVSLTTEVVEAMKFAAFLAPAAHEKKPNEKPSRFRSKLKRFFHHNNQDSSQAPPQLTQTKSSSATSLNVPAKGLQKFSSATSINTNSGKKLAPTVDPRAFAYGRSTIVNNKQQQQQQQPLQQQLGQFTFFVTDTGELKEISDKSLASNTKIDKGDPLQIEYRYIKVVNSMHWDLFGTSKFMTMAYVKHSAAKKEAALESVVLYDENVKPRKVPKSYLKRYHTVENFPANAYGHPTCYYTPGYEGQDITITTSVWEIDQNELGKAIFRNTGALLDSASQIPMLGNYGVALSLAGNLVKAGSYLLEYLTDNDNLAADHTIQFNIRLEDTPFYVGKYVLFPDPKTNKFDVLQNYKLVNNKLIRKSRAGNSEYGKSYYVLQVSNKTNSSLVDFDFAATANNLLKLFKGGNKPQIAANFTKHIIAAANDAHTIRISNQVRELYEQADAAIDVKSEADQLDIQKTLIAKYNQLGEKQEWFLSAFPKMKAIQERYINIEQ